jgi:cathepsin A (carboxypeptidase C)
MFIMTGLLGAAASMVMASASPGTTHERQQVMMMDPPSMNSDYDDSFTLFRHDDHPDKQIRYKRNDGWCDGANTKAWSGYLDFEDSHLFFYYFESRNKPAEDPVVLWINGGAL